MGVSWLYLLNFMCSGPAVIGVSCCGVPACIVLHVFGFLFRFRLFCLYDLT